MRDQYLVFCQLSGLSHDLDIRITHTQHLAESSVCNSHNNRHSIDELSNNLNNLTSEFEKQAEGVIDRHSNQIRVHTDRLADHATDIRRVQALVSSHQTRLESHTVEIKKLSEATAELKAEAAESHKEIETKVKEQVGHSEFHDATEIDDRFVCNPISQTQLKLASHPFSVMFNPQSIEPCFRLSIPISVPLRN